MNNKIVSITSIELKKYTKFFQLSMNAFFILMQMKNTKQLDFKKTGIGKMHYTMTLWENKYEMDELVQTGAHLKSMKVARKFAKEITLYTYNASELPDWKTAKDLLKKGRVIKY